MQLDVARSVISLQDVFSKPSICPSQDSALVRIVSLVFFTHVFGGRPVDPTPESVSLPLL